MGEIPTGKDAVGIMVTPRSRRGCVTFRGAVVKVSNDRTQDTLYHVDYGDGDKDVLGATEYANAYELSLDDPNGGDERPLLNTSSLPKQTSLPALSPS